MQVGDIITQKEMDYIESLEALRVVIEDYLEPIMGEEDYWHIEDTAKHVDKVKRRIEGNDDELG